MPPILLTLAFFATRPAVLSLEFRSDGFMAFTLSAPLIEIDLSELATSLACEPEELAARTSNEERLVSGVCRGPLARKGMTFEGTVSVVDLVQPLSESGVEALTVRVDHPAAGADACFGLGQPAPHERQYALDEDAEPITVAFGYGRRERMALLSPLLAIAIVSLAWTWMRSVRARRQEADDDDTWFRQWQFLRLQKAGLFLSWPVALGWARANDRFHFLSNVEPPGLLVAVSLIGYLGGPSLVAALNRALFQPILARRGPPGPSRADHFWGALFEDAAVLAPFGLALTGLAVSRESPLTGAVLVVVAVVAREALGRGLRRVLIGTPVDRVPEELSARASALAERIGARLLKLVVSTGPKGQPPQAFAANQCVYLSTSLLDCLDKREVDATIAHELSHLKHGHGTRAGLAVVAAAGLAALVLLGWPSRSLPSWAAPVTATWVAAGLFLFYQRWRRCLELLADRDAVAATSDPVALIRGIVTLSRNGEIPLRFRPFDALTLSHPSVEARARAIGGPAGLDGEAFLVDGSSAEKGERYPLPATKASGRPGTHPTSEPE